ncbi:eukaryotic translation initiation factor 5A-1-like [Hylaeus volcanicus]|jgi:translation initiation factor 5A|uniref:eukaryotic translation initiation factor 5A-1-like n=1 Tax=Hylaeus volcanicus TaxID=313075 RepID=UPI0023B81D96|nr:eukaryotic translation initiation factor 5A-1-like [Hylaeus volcanicus]
MDSNNDETFDQVASGASHTYPQQAGAIKKNSFCMLKGKPCKVVDYSTSKTGKHGHAKAHIVGLDIFTGKKYEDMCPTSHNMEIPLVKRAEYQLINIDDGFVTLLNEGGETKDDLRLPTDSEGNHDEVAKKISELFESGSTVLVSVISACGMEKIVGYKVIDS